MNDLSSLCRDARLTQNEGNEGSTGSLGRGFSVARRYLG